MDAWVLHVGVFLAPATNRHNSIAVALQPSMVGALWHRDNSLLYIQFLHAPLTSSLPSWTGCPGCKRYVYDNFADVQVVCSLDVAQHLFVVEPDYPGDPANHRFLDILEE